MRQTIDRSVPPARPSDEADPGSTPAPAVRVAVYAFLAAIVLCGALQLELWPLSAFRLFSQVRSGTQARWTLVQVADDGDEQPVDLRAMGRAFRQTSHLLPSLAAGPDGDRVAACGAWLDRLPDATALRVYRDVLRSPAPGRMPELERHALQFTCERSG